MAPDGTGKDDGRGLIALLTQLSKAFNRRSTEEMLGMRLKEFLILGLVGERPGTTQQEIGETMLMDSNTIVLLLNELESRGFVIRRRDADDRRRHLVEMTASGRQALAKAEKGREAIEDEIFAGLTDDERQTLRMLLLRVLETQARAAATAART